MNDQVPKDDSIGHLISALAAWVYNKSAVMDDYLKAAKGQIFKSRARYILIT